ncbi:MAG: divalent-cation tolerance protein CutA [Pirellulales bacterium]|nr:divalent-cation tolerance protein CutA [Pirellulales bacterium]
MSDYLLICTTTETRAQAEQIARALVDARLAACVQIEGPITSVYRWEGAVTQAAEWRLTAKTPAVLFDRAVELIRREHTYQVPEVIALPIVAGSRDYLAWLSAETDATAEGS